MAIQIEQVPSDEMEHLHLIARAGSPTAAAQMLEKMATESAQLREFLTEAQFGVDYKMIPESDDERTWLKERLTQIAKSEGRGIRWSRKIPDVANPEGAVYFQVTTQRTRKPKVQF